jgi:hypothetical protein
MIRFCHLALEGIMAVRPIGQEVLRFGAEALRPASLDELGAAIDALGWAFQGKVPSPSCRDWLQFKALPPAAMRRSGLNRRTGKI